MSTLEFSSLSSLIKHGRKIDATDIHLKSEMPIFYRQYGDIKILDNDILHTNNIANLILSGEITLSQDDIKKIKNMSLKNTYFHHELNIDTTCMTAPNCRINIYTDINGVNLAIRLLPETIPTMEQLRLPPVVQNFTCLHSGLVVISGPTGSGKTSTLASMLNEIAVNQKKHIITIENPIEYKLKSSQSIVTQREVKAHVMDFADGLKEALRQDPDVIMVGEMRDAETIVTAMQAAETGHLVFTTLHAGDTTEAVDRFSQYFPAERNLEIRNQLANCLQGIVAQKLLPAATQGKFKQVAAFEVLLATDAVKNTIRTGKSFHLKDYMNRMNGMISMAESLAGLKNKNLI